MAKVTFGPLVTDITGSIGGITFQRNRSGNIARLRGGTTKAVTPLQTVHEATLQRWQINWSNLTLLIQEDWNAFALANPKVDRWGTTKTLTGFNMYASVNISLELIGHPTLQSPPAFTVAAPYDLSQFDVDDTEIAITQDGSPTDPQNGLLIFMTPPIRNTTTSFRRHLRLIVSPGVAPAGKLVLTPFWEAAFGQSWPIDGTSNGFKLGVMIVVVHDITGLTSLGVEAISDFVVLP